MMGLGKTVEIQMADCCEDKTCAIDALRVRQSGTLICSMPDAMHAR
jgi:hypothetical protein